MSKKGPEAKIEAALKSLLRSRGWLVKKMHGNVFQSGVPDLYLSHPRFGTRWVDVKNPESWNFTKAQRAEWPVWEKYGSGIWILVAATDEEYDKLFQPPNWRNYWKDSWALPSEAEIDALLDAITLDGEEADAGN